MVNRAMCTFLCKQSADVIGRTFSEVVDPDAASVFQANAEELFRTGGPLTMEETVMSPCGKKFFKTSLFLLYDEEGKAENGCAVNIDISHEKKAAQALSESESRYRTLIDNAFDGIWDWDLSSGDIYFSRRCKEMLGYDQDEWEGNLGDWHRTIFAEDLIVAEERLKRHLENGEPFFHISRFHHKDGSVRWIQVRGLALRDSEGRPYRMIGYRADITERKAAEERLQASLREKETLLKEIHHRVKNNLQIVSSLLNLEENRADERSGISRAGLDSIRNRLQAMRLVHELLYQSSDLASLDFSVYARVLVGELSRLVCPPDRPVRVEFELEPMALDIERAMPCGLLLSELVTNAFKHAFPPGCREPLLVVVCAKLPEGGLRVSVADNGIGMPADTAPAGSRALGLNLAGLLADQIGGRLTREDAAEGGTRWVLTSPA